MESLTLMSLKVSFHPRTHNKSVKKQTLTFKF